jgi:Ca2+-binding RTX toxin-like protein
VTAGTVGLAATALAAPAAHAENFVVNTLSDGAADACTVAVNGCKLRDAITDANANGQVDVITFASSLSGTVRLNGTELPVGSAQALTIQGPGADVLAVNADTNYAGPGESRVFHVTNTGAVTISGLTITKGFTNNGNNGAAILAEDNTDVTILDSEIADSTATGTAPGPGNTADGGGIAALGNLALVRSVVGGNAADDAGGGLFAGGASDVLVEDSEIVDNDAGRGAGVASFQSLVTGTLRIVDSVLDGNDATGSAGGILADSGALEVEGSAITGNTAAGYGGGIAAGNYFKYNAFQVTDSLVSGNTAVGGTGGGMALFLRTPATGTSSIADTTVDDNEAGTNGAGIYVASASQDDTITIARSGITRNTAASNGGGLAVQSVGEGDLALVNSTVSGNGAAGGGGIQVGRTGTTFAQPGSAFTIDNATIAQNTATSLGGGMFLARYGPGGSEQSATVTATSTIVANNTASGSASDLDRDDVANSGGVQLPFGLVEAPLDGLAPTSSTPPIVGTDPQLGALGDNGGPTETQLPANDSPVVDQGKALAGLSIDQRGAARTIDDDAPNAAGGDATDIGAVELAASFPPPLPGPATPVTAGPQPSLQVPQPVLVCNGRAATILAVPGRRTVGTSRRDVIVGTTGREVINGGGGNDIICARGGNDSVSGGTGNDTIFGENGNDRLSGNAGNDRIAGGAGRDSLAGGTGRDQLSGDGGNDALSGGAGNDLLRGGPGNDSLGGGTGNDSLGGGTGNDRLRGNAGNDRLSGNAGRDSMVGGRGLDRFSGGAGRDTPERRGPS